MLALKQQADDAAARKQTTHPARPVKGRVDFVALRRDLKAKFPKTTAYLAK